MSQINVNVVAPLGYTGSVLPGDNDNVEIINSSGDTIFKTSVLNGNVLIGGENASNTVSGVFIGRFAGDSITSNNAGPAVAIGNGALQNSQWTGSNTAVGAFALQDATGIIGINNTAVGSSAGTNITDGISNTCLGQSAGSNLTTGNNNIVIGSFASAATATSSNSVTLGNSSISVLRCQVTSITSLSDARDKKEIEELPVGLDFVKGLKPVKFIWDDRDENGNHDVKDFGFIAQDLKKSQEDANLADTLKLVYEENPEKLEASYGKLIPVLVKAIQELTAKVEALEAK
jgi:hypothetical protein